MPDQSNAIGAVFISYASQDAEAAQRICEGLRAAGIEAWFDQSALRGGDSWDAQIKKQIHECALFLPVISAHTNVRIEGYFRREWNLAVRRLLDMAQDAAFLMPVVIDGTQEADARVPEEFLRAHWTRLPGGEIQPEFGKRMRQLLGKDSDAGRTATSSVIATIEPSTRKVVSRRSWLVTLVTGVVATVAVASWHWWGSAERKSMAQDEPQPLRSIAVLPFVSLSAGNADSYLADGLAESILHRLCDIPRLRVVARTSSFAFRNKSVDIRQIGELLGADAVLEGSVQRSGDRLRVVAQLISTRDGTHRWSKSFDRSATDAFAIQDEISQLISDTIAGGATALAAPPLVTRNAGGAAPPSEAFDQYLQGLAALKTDTVQNIALAITYFRRAVIIDDGYVEAWVGLADAYLAAFRAGNQPSQALQGNAQSALEKAFAIHPEYADAYRALGVLQFSRDFHSDNARRSFEKAIQLNPNIAAAHEGLAWLAVNSQDFAAARTHFELALELNPYSKTTVLDSLVLDQVDGQFSRSLARIRRILWIEPTNAEAYRAYAGVQRVWFGRLDESIRYTRHAATLDPGKLSDLLDLSRDELHLGRTAESQALVDKARRIAPEDADTNALQVGIHLAERNEAAADKAWRRSKALSADGFVPVMFYGSWSLLRAGRARDALSLLLDSRSNDCRATSNSEYVVDLTTSVCGYLLLQVGKSEQGKAVLRQALAELNRLKLAHFDLICWEATAIYASLGEQAHAIETLKRTVAEPRCRLDVQNLDNELFDPRFAVLRENVEFQHILTRIHGDLDRMARDLDARPDVDMEDLAADLPEALSSSAL
jgi:TolB-like protein/Flp pilus assembly protein TadD